MTISRASTVAEYLAELPPERRKVISDARDLVLRSLPKGYDEGMAYGMIYYHVPFSRLAETYNGHPLCYVGLAAQKNFYAFYLMGIYSDPARAKAFVDGFARAGKKLDIGKSCVRFRSLDDLPLDVIASSIAGLTPEQYIALYEKSRLQTVAGRKKARTKNIAAARKPATRTATGKKAGVSAPAAKRSVRKKSPPKKR